MNQTPFRTLILWVIWAATALVVYLTLYRDTDVWEHVEADASHITWLIIGLFLMGLMASFVLVLLVTKEARRADVLEQQAREGGLQSISVLSFKRVADRFFYSIKATLDSRGQPDVETLLNVEVSVYERIARTVELIGHLLITLGLIGTVMGLTLTLTGLTGSLDALGHDQEMLLAGLRKAMGGMGVAFYTTLLGAVLGGVLLRMFALINQHGVESLHDNLLRICLVYCSADLATSLEKDVRMLNGEVQALEANLNRLQDAFGNSRTVVRELGDDIRALGKAENEKGEPLELIVRRHREYCDGLREEMRLLYHVKRPFWVRVLELFSSRRY